MNKFENAQSKGTFYTQDLPKYVPVGNMELITPDMAKAYLKHNEKNPRTKINTRLVDTYARDIKAGKWFPNGEAIVFDVYGNLKNGQHRLSAIVKANVPAYMFVIRGIDPNITTFDYGLNRRVNQELGVNRNIEVITNFVVSDALRLYRGSKGIVRDYIIEHKNELQKAVNLSRVGASGTNAVGVKRNVYCAIYLMLRCGEDPDEIEQFMRVVNTQFMLTERESSSAIVLFKYLSENRRGDTNRNSFLTGIETVMSAFADFSSGTKRTRAYKITSTARAQNMLTAVRKADGLEE